MEKCCVALETAYELKFQAKAPAFPVTKINTFNAALNPMSIKASRVGRKSLIFC